MSVPETPDLNQQAPAADSDEVLEFTKADAAEDLLSTEGSPSSVSQPTPAEITAETAETSAITTP